MIATNTTLQANNQNQRPTTACRKLLAQLATTKAAIFAEFRDALKGDERSLRLALAEAEALAWQTAFPHLLFPTLALEKANAAVAWQSHQQAVRRISRQWAFAA